MRACERHFWAGGEIKSENYLRVATLIAKFNAI